MVAVIMKTTLAGPNGVTRSGKTHNCSAEEAEDLVDGGFADYDGKAPKRSTKRHGGKTVETATVDNNSTEQRTGNDGQRSV